MSENYCKTRNLTPYVKVSPLSATMHLYQSTEYLFVKQNVARTTTTGMRFSQRVCKDSKPCFKVNLSKLALKEMKLQSQARISTEQAPYDKNVEQQSSSNRSGMTCPDFRPKCSGASNENLILRYKS